MKALQVLEAIQRVYYIYHNGEEIGCIRAQTDRAAKLKVSKLCGGDENMYASSSLVYLYDEKGTEIGAYIPCQYKWIN